DVQPVQPSSVLQLQLQRRPAWPYHIPRSNTSTSTVLSSAAVSRTLSTPAASVLFHACSMLATAALSVATWRSWVWIWGTGVLGFRSVL
ncbi:hypothetical protein FS749_015209, partial [Ceratobasidium sp. UAMH 11750]